MNQIKRRRGRAIAGVCAAELMERRTLLSGLALDPTYGTSGVSFSTISINQPSSANAIARTSDGGTVAVGTTTEWKAGNLGRLITVTRYLANGQLNSSFGKGGTENFSVGADDEAFAVAVQADGKIVIGAGSSTVGPSFPEYYYALQSPRFTVIRLNADGSMDNGFGSGGVVFDGSGSVKGLTVTGGGQIIAVGSTGNANYVSPGVIQIARLNSNGSLDNTFNSSGTATTSFGPYPSEGDSVAIDSAGELVVFGTLYTSPSTTEPVHPMSDVILRYQSNGALDTSFHSTGSITESLIAPSANHSGGAGSVVLGSAGKIDYVTVSGQPNANASAGVYTFQLTQFTSTGAADATFGSAGTTSWNVSSAALPIQNSGFIQLGVASNGNLVVGASIDTDSNYVLSSTVSATGVVQSTSPLSAVPGQIEAATIASDGSVTFSGVNGFNVDASNAWTIVHLTAAGSLDSTFGSSGIVLTPISAPTFESFGTSFMQPDGKLLVGGLVLTTTGYDDLILRFSTDGSLDQTFGAGGEVLVPVSGTYVSSDAFSALAIQHNGSILALGGPNLYRFSTSGVLDTSFGNGGSAAVHYGSGLLVQADNKIVVNEPTAIVRFTADGQPDDTFGNNSVFSGTPQYPYYIPYVGTVMGISQAGNGDLLAAGQITSNGPGLFALLPNGTLDTSFGNNGVAYSQLFFSATHGPIAVLPSGMIVPAGDYIARYTATGQSDGSFNQYHENPTTFGTDDAFSLDPLSNGDLLYSTAYGGTNSSGGAPIGAVNLVELNSSGTLDPSFGTGGSITVNLGMAGGLGTTYVGAYVRPNGTIVVVAYGSPAASAAGGIVTAQFVASVPPSVGTQGLTVAAGQTYHLPALNSSGISIVGLNGLTIASGGTAIVDPAATGASRQVVNATGNGLSIAGTTGAWTGTLNLNNNDLDIASGSLTNVTSQLVQGYSNGTWNGAGGLTSSAAANDTTHLTTLGVIQNNQSGAALFSTSKLFDGIAPGAGDVMVKYTYYGDANLDGKVDGSDYARIDNGYLAHATGWFNGDFNYDGIINGSDYTLIDNAFNRQGASLTAQVAVERSGAVVANVWSSFATPNNTAQESANELRKKQRTRLTPLI